MSTRRPTANLQSRQNGNPTRRPPSSPKARRAPPGSGTNSGKTATHRQSSSSQILQNRKSEKGAVSASERAAKRDSIVVKVGMVGDAQIGKTSLMVKYVEGKFGM